MITDKEIVRILKKATKEAGSMRQWALEHKVSPAYVSDVLKGKREPGKKILNALGYERIVTVVISKKDNN